MIKKVVMIFWVAMSVAVASMASPIQVLVSIPPEAYFVKKIAGDRVNIEILLPPGKNPAIFEPSPAQVRKIKGAQVYFAMGLPFEMKWIRGAQDINPQLNVVKLYATIKRRPIGKERQDSRFLDPHIWLSPSLARLMSQEVLHYFCSHYREDSSFYLKNYYLLAREIDELDMDILTIFKNIKKRHFLVFHPCWGYFARDYGLFQLAIEEEGREPGPARLSYIIEMAKRYHIHTVFVQPEFSKRMAQVVAKYLGAKVVELDPLARNWSQNLREVARKLARSLMDQR